MRPFSGVGIYLKSAEALTSVFQTPQRRGTATRAQVTTTHPHWSAGFGWLSCSATIPSQIIFRVTRDYADFRAHRGVARSAASSWSLMKKRSATGRTARLQKKPPTSRPANTYIVTLYAWAAGTPRSIWYSRM